MQWSVRDHAAWRVPDLARGRLPKIPTAAAGVGAVVILTAIAHTLAVWPVALLLSHGSRLDQVRQIAVAAAHDEVYARLILSMLGNIRVVGLTNGPGVSLLFSAGSSAVGVQAAEVAVNLVMVLAGAAGALTLNPWPRLLASVWLAYGAGSELRLSWGSGSGGEIGLSMVATKLLGINGRLYDAALRHDWLVSVAVNFVLIALAAAAGAVTTRLIRRRRQRLLRRPAPYAAAALTLALLLGMFSPAATFPRVQAAAPTPASGPARTGLPSRWPSVVTITPNGSGRGWMYAVNGRPESVLGLGYNAVTAQETPAERGARYDRDFAAISAAGANTLVGWSEQEFDGLLLQKAAQHGLGVLLPFKLGPDNVLSEPDYRYEDAHVRQQLLEHVTERVEQYRNSPALRMWGLGNEVLHTMAWSRAPQERVNAFAAFLLAAADRVHELDPNHPVIYRDAEDWYTGPISKALAENPRSRPWLVYGMNFFRTTLRNALTSGPATTLHQPLFISEFGPVGLRPEARPAGYRELWDIIREHTDTVLGGSAYVWSTAGPEPLDRNFGLTDANGEPVDGALSELSALYEAAVRPEATT